MAAGVCTLMFVGKEHTYIAHTNRNLGDVVLLYMGTKCTVNRSIASNCVSIGEGVYFPCLVNMG